jgi:hypothetical protein
LIRSDSSVSFSTNFAARVVVVAAFIVLLGRFRGCRQTFGSLGDLSS